MVLVYFIGYVATHMTLFEPEFYWKCNHKYDIVWTPGINPSVRVSVNLFDRIWDWWWTINIWRAYLGQTTKPDGYGHRDFWVYRPLIVTKTFRKVVSQLFGNGGMAMSLENNDHRKRSIRSWLRKKNIRGNHDIFGHLWTQAMDKGTNMSARVSHQCTILCWIDCFKPCIFEERSHWDPMMMSGNLELPWSDQRLFEGLLAVFETRTNGCFRITSCCFTAKLVGIILN